MGGSCADPTETDQSETSQALWHEPLILAAPFSAMLVARRQVRVQDFWPPQQNGVQKSRTTTTVLRFVACMHVHVLVKCRIHTQVYKLRTQSFVLFLNPWQCLLSIPAGQCFSEPNTQN